MHPLQRRRPGVPDTDPTTSAPCGAAFADIGNQPPRSYEFWVDVHLERSDFDPALWLLAVRRDQPGRVPACGSSTSTTTGSATHPDPGATGWRAPVGDRPPGERPSDAGCR
jgi:hypothetical protein